jgi:hypothetical protein
MNLPPTLFTFQKTPKKLRGLLEHNKVLHMENEKAIDMFLSQNSGKVFDIVTLEHIRCVDLLH